MYSQSGGRQERRTDRVSINLLKVVTDCRVGDTIPLATCALVAIINASFRAGVIAPWFKKGVITMIPKQSVGSQTANIADYRPITLLSEIGKTASRILANRICNILARNPHILNAAQRAFIKDGNTAQCIDTVLDVFEDFKTRRGKSSKERLFFLSYDQSKAYDSVQKYSIRAALVRFNFPEKFISYIESSLEGAFSAVKTAHGLTPKFPILTSVRQGCPLAPLIFIFYTDALHAGLASNPLYDGRNDGYIFSNDQSLRVSSSGYADDTAAVSGSSEGIFRMHQWVRCFFRAHHCNINCSKTHFICSHPNEQS